jgi:ribosomal protein L37AE/L43A
MEKKHEEKKEQKESQVKCPWCGRKKAVQKKAEHIYFCTWCDKMFDPEED